MQWRNRALAKWRKINGANLQPIFKNLIDVDPGDREEWDDSIEELMNVIDLKYLMVGGIDLSLAVDEAASTLGKRTGTENFTFNWDTPLGRIALRGGQNDKYPKQPYLLVVDSGGNDVYSGGGATHDAAHPVAVALDLGGDDRYIELPELAATPVAAFARRKVGSTQPVFGAGVLGYGILVDASGNDVYRSLTNTQGRGLFGLGILQDRGGDDRYDCYTGGQGAANFGVGVLADVAGNDEYLCFTTSQGFGSTKGCGVLVDVGGGDDRYNANDTIIDFPSPQDANHNATLAQGAGFGRRADYSDGHSLAGGVGALVDGGGKNNFSCGVYGQGAGYWYGVGLLCAGEGEDTYRGVWYVQGAVAHFAVGVLWDAGGNDSYKATHNMAQGAGHDFGTGFLIEEAGNDRYEAPSLSLGGGNANGFGLFWDKSGDDTYLTAPGITLGRGNIENRPLSLRDRNITLGIFLDTGGKDVYPANIAYARDNVLWTMAENSPPPNSFIRGAGLDTEETGKLP